MIYVSIDLKYHKHVSRSRSEGHRQIETIWLALLERWPVWKEQRLPVILMNVELLFEPNATYHWLKRWYRYGILRWTRISRGTGVRVHIRWRRVCGRRTSWTLIPRSPYSRVNNSIGMRRNWRTSVGINIRWSGARGYRTSWGLIPGCSYSMVNDRISAAVISVLTCERVNILIVAPQVNTRSIFLDELDNLVYVCQR